MNLLHVHFFDTVFGLVRTASTEKGLALVGLPGLPQKQFDRQVIALAPDKIIRQGGQFNHRVEKQLQEYFRGSRKQFDLALDLVGTPFQLRVLRRVARIPYGQTRSYGEIAKVIGSPGAARAVGSANAQNRLPIVIPCHRIVAAASLGGYGGGLKLKQKLLRLEGAI